MKRILIIVAILLAGLLYFATPANAQATCATVRCASGGCIDTPGGPVCGAKSTCASTLCMVGNQCVETAQGATCVPASQPYYSPPQYIPPQYAPPHYYYRPRYKRYRPHYANRHHYNPYRNRRWQNDQYYQNWYTPRPQPQPAPTPTPTPTPGRPDACTMQYEPVCAQKQVQCVRAPCPPVTRTFSNSCQASVEDYSVIYSGECR